ncbi:MAG: Gfo/Idh/MocA family oxidoreductase [Candidatus Omnitrophica bacterium]|nr:Gfo/Idh/MocA family oxidoreductase [Candidatus Omnitrophota bacterium]
MSGCPNDTLRIGLLGCGAISQFAHLPALAKARGVRLAALCDGAEDLLQTIGRRNGVQRLYTRYEELLGDSEVDAVLIAAPDPFHVPLALEALQAGKHVLVEKPLSDNSVDCEALVRAVRETGLKLQVGCMKRHDPGIAYAHEFIRDRLGPVFSVSGWYRDTSFRPAIQETLLPPLLNSAHSVRPRVDPKGDRQRYSLWTHSAHLFDNLLFLAGPIRAVTAKLARLDERFSWHGVLEFADGGVGNFELSVKVNEGWSEGYIVHGAGGSVHVETFIPFYHRPSMVRAFDASGALSTTPLGEHSNPFKNQLEAFARAVREDLPPSPDVYDGLAVVRIIEAVERSVTSGERIEIPPTVRPTDASR